jgi:hypothetical protein
VARKVRIRKAKQKKDYEKRATRPASAKQSADRSPLHTSGGSALAEEGIIRCLVRDPTLMKVVGRCGFSVGEFTSPLLVKVYQVLAGRLADGRDMKESLILSELEPDEASLLTAILQKPESLPDSEKTMREYIEKIRTEKLKTSDPDAALLLEIRKRKSENLDT